MKRVLSITLTAIMLVSMLFSVVPSASADGWFTDIEKGKWYYNSVKYVYENGLMVGTTDTEFSPNANFSRAMLVTVLWRVEGEPNAPASPFTDVPTGKWYSKAVAWAAKNDIVAGFSSGKFFPNDPVTREQMTSIFMRYADYLGIDTSDRANINSFSDASKVGSWAKDSMRWALAIKLMYGVGNNKIDPKGNATRAQSAAILERFCNEVLAGWEPAPKPEPEPEPTPTPTPDQPDDELPDDWDPDIDGDNTPIVDGEATTRYNYDSQYRITEKVTNDNGIILDSEQGLPSSSRYATAQTKYDFDKNPIINRDRQVNKEVLPSFNLDSTNFVRAGTKLSDLKGKKLEFFTADTYAAWSYRNSKGETIDEWQWFKDLKEELGLSIKYTMKQHEASTNAVIQYMNAGKQCDIVYSNHSILALQALNISKSIAELVSQDGLDASPGVCSKAMELTKWGGTPRLIAPIGVVDVLWYNQTLTQEMGLSDPHVMWENGAWNWNNFKKFMMSVPSRNPSGQSLVAWTCFPSNIYFTWDSTTGKQTFSLVGNSKVPTILNNWNDPQIQEAWDFVAGVNQVVNFKCGNDNGGLGVVPEHMGLYNGTTVMSATMYTQVYRDTEYSKHVQINWVPFPKANGSAGKESAQFYGFGMLLPKKTVLPENENIALKFMELWATRFTEAYYDNLNTFEYYNFNYKQRKQYFNYVTSNLVYSPAVVNASRYGNMVAGFLSDSCVGYVLVSAEAQKYSQQVALDLASAMKYGM